MPAKFKPTEQQRSLVRALAIAETPQPQIASQIINKDTGAAITPKTLRAHFRDEINHALNQLIAKSVSVAVEKIKEGDWQVAKFMLETKGGFVKPHHFKGDGPGGSIPLYDLSSLSKDELKQFIALTEKVENKTAGDPD